MPPIEVPNNATLVIPRSPSQARAPATSSTSRSPNVVGPSSEFAVAPEVEAKNSGRPPQERPVFDEIGCNRARPAVEKQDRLVRIGLPRLRPALRALGRQPPTCEPQAVTRSEADDLATERVELRAERRLGLGRPRRVEQPPCAAPDHETGGRRRQGGEAREYRQAADQRSAAGRLPSSGAMPRSTKPAIGSSSRVNSVGMTNFVAGLEPSALSASRYWSAIVFASIPEAAP